MVTWGTEKLRDLPKVMQVVIGKQGLEHRPPTSWPNALTSRQPLSLILTVTEKLLLDYVTPILNYISDVLSCSGEWQPQGAGCSSLILTNRSYSSEANMSSCATGVNRVANTQFYWKSHDIWYYFYLKSQLIEPCYFVSCYETQHQYDGVGSLTAPDWV